MGTTSPTNLKAPRRKIPFPIRLGIYLLLLALTIIADAAGYAYRRIRQSLPQLDGAIQAPGLAGQVEVRRDARGVPHLRGQSLEDVLFAQGYVTAQDRLWQMDLSRRLAFGELAEIFGERLVPRDVENRTLDFIKVAKRAVEEMDPETRKLCSAYTRGVNTFIESHKDSLPIEFSLLNYHPRRWEMRDSFGVALNMAKALNTTWPDELMQERIRSKVAPELYADLFP